jgi:hypothetical protein
LVFVVGVGGTFRGDGMLSYWEKPARFTREVCGLTGKNQLNGKRGNTGPVGIFSPKKIAKAISFWGGP